MYPWNGIKAVAVCNYWSGTEAPKPRHFETRLLWSDRYIHVLFESQTSEELLVAVAPDLNKKTIGLWNGDVVEIFIAPDKDEPRKYFEFEAGPRCVAGRGVGFDERTRVPDWNTHQE